MEAENRTAQKFLVLVPHKDVRSLLRKSREEQLKNGLTGVYSFPLASPVAEVSEEFTAEELKYAARSLREITGGETIKAAEETSVEFLSGKENPALWGLRLNINLPDKIFGEYSKKIKKIFTPLVIGSLLIPENIKQQFCAFTSQEALSFRAAAVANMSWKPFHTEGGIAYKWKIGKLAWLPKKL